LYNFIVKVFLDSGAIPDTSTMGVNKFRQENGNYKTTRRRMMAPLSIIQCFKCQRLWRCHCCVSSLGQAHLETERATNF